jgi:uncharacterized protein YrrD
MAIRLTTPDALARWENEGGLTNSQPTKIMLFNTKDLKGTKLLATDGEIGHIHDVYFDDQTWALRYLVVDTGSWLIGRQVLLAPQCIGSYHPETETLCINLLKQQIEASPPKEAHRPVSRQYEEAYYRYYGWPAYWNGDALTGLGAYPILLPPTAAEIAARKQHVKDRELHLRSAEAVTGYAIEAIDGTIGHVSGFLLDERDWQMQDIVAETGPWYSHKSVLIPAGEIKRISYEDSKVFVTMSREQIKHTEKNRVVASARIAN